VVAVRTQSIDTPAELEGLQIARFRQMGPRARLAAALELNELLDRLAVAGLRARHGPLPADEERVRLFALRLDPLQMRAAFGWSPGQDRG
jgi:hypothetical protein